MSDTSCPLLLSVLLDDEDSGLDRIVSLLRRRRVPIDSLSMQRTVAPGTTWLSLALGTSGVSPHRIREELRKLIAVRDVQTLDPAPQVMRAPSTPPPSASAVAPSATPSL